MNTGVAALVGAAIGSTGTYWIKVRTRTTAQAIMGAITGPAHAPHTAFLARYDTRGVLRLTARTTPLRPATRGDLAATLHPADTNHPWHGMRLSAGWGSRELLDFTPVRPDHVAEFSGDVAIETGRYRHPVRLLRLLPGMVPEDVPRFDRQAL